MADEIRKLAALICMATRTTGPFYKDGVCVMSESTDRRDHGSRPFAVVLRRGKDAWIVARQYQDKIPGGKYFRSEDHGSLEEAATAFLKRCISSQLAPIFGDWLPDEVPAPKLPDLGYSQEYQGRFPEQSDPQRRRRGGTWWNNRR